MKKAILALGTAAYTLLGIETSAQTPFAFDTKEFVDVNNIKSAILVHGDMNWDPQLGQQCEFPKGSGRHVSMITSIWMAGYDPQLQLRVSAQTFKIYGNDFWPGPLDNNGALNISTSTDWAKIWKVSFIDIGNHLANSVHTTSNTPPSILEWPAKGNPHAKGNNNVTLTITNDMAPFVDVNSDGIYNAIDGDYPKIKGDQALWWVFSDNGPTHDNSKAQPMHIEVHAMAYAYNRGTLIDNIVYYDMTLHNRSNMDYTAYRVGIHSDIDLGYFRDDYVGFDSARRLAYAYNGNVVDGAGQPSGYGNNPPVSGFTLLHTPGDNSTLQPTGSFLVFRNDMSILGNPQNGQEYNNYLRSMARNGDHIKNDYTGYGTWTTGLGTGPNTNYMYDGNPADTSQWSECSSTNTPGDRRFVLASSDYTFKANSSTNFTFALVVADMGPNNTCPNFDITKIQTVTDTAWKNYLTTPAQQVSVAKIAKGQTLQLYPNPASNIVYINTPLGINANTYQLSVYDVTGKKMMIDHKFADNKIEMNVASLPAGVYQVIYNDDKTTQTSSFVKE